MDILLSLLAFTGLIVILMRLLPRRESATMISDHLPGGVDPVCGMTVHRDLGFAAMHHGEEYRFCSVACLDKFEASRRQYTKRAA